MHLRADFCHPRGGAQTTKAELEELQNNGPHDKPTLVLISKQW